MPLAAISKAAILVFFGMCAKEPAAAFLPVPQYKFESRYAKLDKLFYREPIIYTELQQLDAISQVPEVELERDIIDIETSVLYSENNGVKHCHSLASTLNVEHIPMDQTSFQYPIKVIGHRGSPFKYLENTSLGFINAAQVGADGVELDVFLLKCGTLVVFHGSGGDAESGLLHSYCSVEGSILDYTAEEARLLTFNRNFDEFGCGSDAITHPSDSVGGIPHYCYVHTLEEVLETLRDNTSPNFTVKIELKGPDTAAPSIELVRKLKMERRCQYSSFDHSRIAEVQVLDPNAITGALYASEVPENFVEHCLAIGANEVHFKYDTCTYERVQAAHAAGLGTMAWFRGPAGMRDDHVNKYFDCGNEDMTQYRTVLLSGVRSMCVNRPDVMVKTLESLQAASLLRP